jgi:TolA-binding protein
LRQLLGSGSSGKLRKPSGNVTNNDNGRDDGIGISSKRQSQSAVAIGIRTRAADQMTNIDMEQLNEQYRQLRGRVTELKQQVKEEKQIGVDFDQK